ncbi:insecticyanin-A [Plutella xylostella]|uniref:insecticyanin-A n=1 Tax=Plutella xylostella TaxID=51655 RepID=UPI0020322318|nr:insecticyanin-A [Plutella xylostella]
MFKLFLFLILGASCHCYFTLPGKCPEGVTLQQDFRLADFFGTWHQAFHYASDHQHLSNCSTLELQTQSSGIYLNISRVDRGLFHRYSIGALEIPTSMDNAAKLDVIFTFKDAPRRLMRRQYPFRVLATNYNYYATVYTCSYSPLIDKHYIYVWLLSRKPSLNVVSKELAMKPLQQLGIKEEDLIKEETSNCSPKYYEDVKSEPVTFRFPVVVKV